MTAAPPKSRLPEQLVWGGLLLVTLGVVVVFLRAPRTPHVPAATLPVIQTLSDFTLTNQLGRPVRLADLRGHVWIAAIIFTRCPGPCATMTTRLAQLQTALPAAQPVRFVSLTTDPGHDTPAVLQEYATRFGAQPGRWHFLTGPKEEIVRLAVDGLKLTTLEKDPAQRQVPTDLFIHSTIFVVVDRLGRLRAAIECLDTVQTEEQAFAGGPPASTQWESDLKPRLLRTVETLLREK